MSKHRKAEDTVDTLAEDAHALLDATSHVAGEKVAEARERLTDALERGKEMYGRAKETAIKGVKTSDKFVRDNPYVAVAIGIGIGTLIGLYLRRDKED